MEKNHPRTDSVCYMISYIPITNIFCRANHSNFDLDDEDNDFAELDFSELNHLAGYKEDEIMDPEAGVEPEGGDRADA